MVFRLRYRRWKQIKREDHYEKEKQGIIIGYGHRYDGDDALRLRKPKQLK